MKIEVKTAQHDYDILIERGLLSKAGSFVGNQRVFIISDDGVPASYQQELQKQFPDAPIHIFPQGERSKNIDVYRQILEQMLKNNISRKDLIIALGGGVVSDLSGFVAASYMRGISYINIATTTLSQIDSSVGGKTAIDLGGVKNSVGAFWQPSLVIIDPNLLETLPERHFNNGLIEAVKMGLIADEELFGLFEKDDHDKHIEEIICRSIMTKKKIVELDERESGIRQLLNFGHTIGHAYESYYDGLYLHGECVGMGMLKMIDDEQIRNRLSQILQKMNAPLACDADKKQIFELIRNDKKADHETLNMIEIEKIGQGKIVRRSLEDIRRIL